MSVMMCHIDKQCLIVVSQFGWGLEIDAEKLKEINESRHGKDYFDKIAATEVNGNTKKTDLTESPFLITFEYGGDRGYWTGNHMILQVEDCIDCLRVLHNDCYRYVFLFDHSSGHAKKRIGGLDVGAMNKGFGGKNMRGTLIEKRRIPWAIPQRRQLTYDSGRSSTGASVLR